MSKTPPLRRAPDAPFPEPLNPLTEDVDIHGATFEDGVAKDDTTRIWRQGQDLLMKDGHNPTPVSVSTVVASGLLMSNAFMEEVRDGTTGRLTKVIYWTSVAKIQKIREVIIDRDVASRITGITRHTYDSAGVLVNTLTRAITRDAQYRIKSMLLAVT